MSHAERVREEFSRQAETMAAAPAFQSADVLGRLRAALGPEPAGRVLDLACGPGIVAEALAPQARAMVGIDATPKMAGMALRRLRAAGQPQAGFAVAAAERLPFAARAFDAVVTRLALHHFAELPPALAEIRRVLASAGRLVVADLITTDDPDAARLHNALEILRDPTHIRMLPKAELLEALGAAGFDVVFTATWEQPRKFGEWAQIVADPARTAPLKEVMRALARRGAQAGVGLREAEDELLFTHTWLLAVALPAPS